MKITEKRWCAVSPYHLIYSREEDPTETDFEKAAASCHEVTPYQEMVIDRLDHIIDLLLKNEREEVDMAHEVRDAIAELVATTAARTTIEAGLETSIHGAVDIMTAGTQKIIELVSDLADNAGDAAAVREITAKLQQETSAMQASRDALVAATAPLAVAVQANTGGTGGGQTSPPMEPATFSTEPEPELSVSPTEPLRTEGNI